MAKWLAGKIVEHIGNYGSKAAEGFVVFNLVLLVLESLGKECYLESKDAPFIRAN